MTRWEHRSRACENSKRLEIVPLPNSIRCPHADCLKKICERKVERRGLSEKAYRNFDFNLHKLTELEQRKCSGLLNREEVWLLVKFLKIKFPLRFSIEKRELLVRGHPLRKLEKPSRYIRIPEGTHGGRRRLFRSWQGFQINRILVPAQYLVFLERYLAAFLNTR